MASLPRPLHSTPVPCLSFSVNPFSVIYLFGVYADFQSPMSTGPSLVPCCTPSVRPANWHCKRQKGRREDPRPNRFSGSLPSGVQLRVSSQQRPCGRAGKVAACTCGALACRVSLSQGRNGTGKTWPILESLGRRRCTGPGSPSPDIPNSHLHCQVLPWSEEQACPACHSSRGFLHSRASHCARSGFVITSE